MFDKLKKYSLLSIVSSPFILAIPLAIILIIYLPDNSSKYSAELISTSVIDKPDSYIYYHDFDLDGADESVLIFHNLVKGKAAIKINQCNEKGVDQWNFNGYYQNIEQSHFIYDFNKDNYKEVYVFFYRNDSLFMSGIQPFPNKKKVLNEFFITTIDKYENEIDYSIRSIRCFDVDKDSLQELVFIVHAGFSKQPRQLMIFDFQDYSLKKTPSTGMNLSHLEILDLDGDELPEFYLSTGSAGNIPDSLEGIDFNDYNSWLVVYDHKLNLIGKPIQNYGKPSSIAISSFTDENRNDLLVAYFSTTNPLDDSIVVFTNDLNKINSIKVFIESAEQKSVVLFLPFEYKHSSGLICCRVDNKYWFINNQGSITKIDAQDDDFWSLVGVMDLNKNGNSELIFKELDASQYIISDNTLKNKVKVNSHTELFSENPSLFGVKKTSTGTQFYILAENKLYFYKYTINRLYYFRHFIWALIYGIVVFILWSTQKLQKIQASKKQQVEDLINSLQFKTIKSQLEPHFMFNVLNALAHNVTKQNKLESHDQIIRFSKLLRTLMTRVDKLDISLREEIEFIGSYLELEKFRFEDDFYYIIEVDEGINLNHRIPRMLIQLLVENSIKHGLRHKAGKKVLNISVSGNSKIRILVEDNGLGRKKAGMYKQDSGQGIKLIEKMISLNKKAGGRDISFDYTDLYNDNGVAMGTRVEVVLG